MKKIESNRKPKSIKLNIVLNSIRSILSIIFPLITFPYISRVLSVDNLGRYNFANSVISYFVLLAGLGISTYAVREGAGIRDDKSRIKNFVDQVFSINLMSTLLSYVLLFIMMFLIPKFADYKALLIILSLQIVFKTIGVEWLYSIYEDYLYITVRSIIFQVISIVLLFAFVRNENDVNAYAIITVVSAVGSNLLNYLHSKKYCRVGVTFKVDWKRHIKPIMILFALTMTVTIYVSSDNIILGFLCDDYTVGIYSVATKIYNIIKTVLNAVLIVTVPRISALIGKGDQKGASAISSRLYKLIITAMLPAMVGIIVLRKEIVLIIAGKDYITATSSLSILSVALIFCIGGSFWGQCVLVPNKQEMFEFKATLVSAIVNILFNFALIPFWKENAAAITTLIAELICFIWLGHIGKRYITISGTTSTIVKVVIGCAAIVGVSLILMPIKDNMILYTSLTILISVIAYALVEILVKNEVVITGLKDFFPKIAARVKR